ncbi:MAG: signal peptide peptidase SppA [Candidatus Woesearchaeota archaeon]
MAVIPINGVITAEKGSSFFGDEASSSTEIIKMINQADKNPAIKAIIFEINSPGGSAVASDEVSQRIKKLNKTNVAYIREIGTSGAYWIASSTDRVFANRMSITGSIGVIGSYLEFSGLFRRYNVTYERLVSGEYKDIGSPYKEMTEKEREIYQKNLDIIRNYFVEEVANNRGIPKKEVDKIANGLFYLGVQAKELGLIDDFGGREEAVKYVEEKLGIKASVIEYKKREGFWATLTEAMNRNSFFVGRGISASFKTSNNNGIMT